MNDLFTDAVDRAIAKHEALAKQEREQAVARAMEAIDRRTAFARRSLGQRLRFIKARLSRRGM